MPHIYLDFNILVSIIKEKNQQLADDIDRAKVLGCKFPYSPAHVEELSVIYRKVEDFTVADAFVTPHILRLGEISDSIEYLPSEHGSDGPGRIVIEHPCFCFERVWEYYEHTFAAEEAMRFSMCSKSPEAFAQVQQEFGTNVPVQGVTLLPEFREMYGIDLKHINTVSPEELLTLPNVLRAIDVRLRRRGYNLETLPTYEEFKHSFNMRQDVIDCTMNCMEAIGYKANKYKDYRSQMHDTSHAIYGSMADIFVTDDNRLLLRMQAAYALLGVPTKVVSVDEFQKAVREAVQIHRERAGLNDTSSSAIQPQIGSPVACP